MLSFIQVMKMVDIDDLTDGEDEDMVPVENKKKLPYTI